MESSTTNTWPDQVRAAQRRAARRRFATTGDWFTDVVRDRTNTFRADLFNRLDFPSLMNMLEATHRLPENVPQEVFLRKLVEYYYSGPATFPPYTIGQLHIRNERRLTALPPLFCTQLASLRFLTIEDTAIERLPDNFGELHNLWSLYIIRTPLTVLPESFGALTHLDTIIFERTLLRSLSVALHAFTELTTLVLRHNAILERLWPDADGGAPTALTRLEVIQNPSFRHFPDCTALRALTLLTIAGNNQLTSLPSFRSLNRLERLELAGNAQLTSLPNDWFGGGGDSLPANFVLVVVDSALASLPLGDLTSLQTLVLRRNTALVSLSGGGRLVSIDHLELVDNPALAVLPESFIHLRPTHYSIDRRYGQLRPRRSKWFHLYQSSAPARGVGQ